MASIFPKKKINKLVWGKTLEVEPEYTALSEQAQVGLPEGRTLLRYHRTAATAGLRGDLKHTCHPNQQQHNLNFW